VRRIIEDREHRLNKYRIERYILNTMMKEHGSLQQKFAHFSQAFAWKIFPGLLNRLYA
jgi:hypothetical protein